MLLFNRYGIKVYGEPLPDDTSDRGPRRLLAEKASIKRLMKEAFDGRPVPRIGHHETGAPFLSLPPGPGGNSAGPLPAISVSHCRSMAAIALAPHGTKVGIDCESGDRLSQLDRIAPRFLSDEQLPYWGERPATLWAWSLKEALYKAVGRPGLSLAWIPLPLEVPVGDITADSSVEIAGEHFYTLQIDITPLQAVLMLAFSAKME